MMNGLAIQKEHLKTRLDALPKSQIGRDGINYNVQENVVTDLTGNTANNTPRKLS